MPQLKAQYELLGALKNKVFIVDLDGPKSITNDAEAVVAQLLKQYGTDTEIFYRDTEGDWAQLLHNRQEFAAFASVDPQAMYAWLTALTVL